VFHIGLILIDKGNYLKGELRKEKGDFLCEVSAEAKLALIMPSHEKFHEDEVRIKEKY
jgi:hypothetical protein